MFQLIHRATHCRTEAGPLQTLEGIDPPEELRNLFPNTKDIALQGDIHPVLAQAILQGEGKPGLTNLTLENIGEPINRRHNTLAQITTEGLQCRCHNLKVLKVRKEGHFLRRWSPTAVEDDLNRYRLLARIILLLGPECLVFAHGQQADSINHDCAPWSIESNSQVTDYPKDERFRDIIAPLLSKGWPALKAIDIRGVSKASTDSLRNLSPQLVVSEECELE
jgi:hypothetical protein